MAIKSSLLLLFISINLASGIILPGSCPPSKPSDELTESNLKGFHVTASVIASVPFATRNSYLFRDILLVKDPQCHYVIFGSYPTERSIHFKYGHTQSNCPYSLSKQMGHSADNASLIFESEVGYSPRGPHNCAHLQEEVRLWILDGGAVIVWSCEELKAGKAHDEAVLLVQESPIHFDDDTFGEKVKRLQVNIGSYLKAPLLENIIWPNLRQRKMCTNKDDCYTSNSNCMAVKQEKLKSKQNNSIGVLVIVGLILIPMIGMLVWNIYSQWNIERVLQVAVREV